MNKSTYLILLLLLSSITNVSLIAKIYIVREKINDAVEETYKLLKDCEESESVAVMYNDGGEYIPLCYSRGELMDIIITMKVAKNDKKIIQEGWQ